MSRLNKLLIEQADIFLAPGSYFHPEFNEACYHQLPAVLQKQHNRQLIKQYALTLPDEYTQLLPKTLAQHWALLPEVALGLGIALHPEPLPWWGELAQYQKLRTPLSFPLEQINAPTSLSPQSLLAQGAAQLLSCLAPFGRLYTCRAQYMFNRATQQLIPTSPQTMLPWNIIEETCHYVSRNHINRNHASTNLSRENTTNN